MDSQLSIDMDQLRSIVREIVADLLAEMSEDTDPDAGLAFKPEVANYLRAYAEDRPEGRDLDDVIKDLGLDV